MTKNRRIAAAQSVRFRIGRIRFSARGTAVIGLMFLAGVSGIGQLHAEDGSGFGCVDQMTLPVYGGIVWQAQITGTATARIVVSSEGAPSEVKIDSPHKALTGWIAGALSKASFRKECKGQTIVLTFKYSLQGQKREAPDNQIIVRHPGTVEITAYPPVLHQIVN